MGGPGRRSDSRSPPRRFSQRYSSRDRGHNNRGRQSDSSAFRRGARGDSRGRSGGSRYSPPRRRSRSRDPLEKKREERSRDRGRRPIHEEFRIPPPKNRTEMSFGGPDITPEHRAASIECNGYLYATIEFTPPVQNPPWGTSAPAQYDYQTKSDISVTRTKTLPRGWSLVPSPPDETVKEQIIKIYPWGTHLLVLEGGHAYWTAKGDNPGAMEAIWDYDKYPGRYALKPRYGRVSSWHGTFLVRIKDDHQT
eukprot:TRINITY_DN56621_c0_g1_i1.p1 TRINITY_DN56621_c0_g1~~TRINITY_DN56621_c0_g1_i1.p1  ORF type:complete len:251 (-),score=11.27 TRINITY_DN56621_c0_g1_i1:632-1384(-)